jgi:hypothetical protein
MLRVERHNAAEIQRAAFSYVEALPGSAEIARKQNHAVGTTGPHGDVVCAVRVNAICGADAAEVGVDAAGLYGPARVVSRAGSERHSARFPTPNGHAWNWFRDGAQHPRHHCEDKHEHAEHSSNVWLGQAAGKSQVIAPEMKLYVGFASRAVTSKKGRKAFRIQVFVAVSLDVIAYAKITPQRLFALSLGEAWSKRPSYELAMRWQRLRSRLLRRPIPC